ncbi:hypothetical protein Acsp02_21350 [Actinoplanes sp. NBRC 103695]|nr:hypothetical protein Acsp02_21350 [Actinoplanes sp. NBRC 103695]
MGYEMTATSREVVEQVMRAGREADVEAFAGLMAPDASIEWPYRPPGAPAGVRGRAEIRAFLAEGAGKLVRFDEYRDVVLHETTDPEVIIVEYAAYGTVIRTGAPFHQTVIAVIRVRGGQVLSYRDYLNPLVLAEVLGSGPAHRS